MKKSKIVLASISLLGIAGSILAFKATYSKRNPAYYTFNYNAPACNTFTMASAIVGGFEPTVYYTLVKCATARIYASLIKNQ